MIYRIFIFLVLFFTCLYANDYDNLAPDIKRISKKGKIIVAMVSKDQYPFFYVNEMGELEGVDVDIAKNIAQELGVEVEFNRDAKSFDDVVNLVAEKKADLAISKLSRTLNRSKKVLYSNPYIVFKQGLLINRIAIAKYAEESQKGIVEWLKNFNGKIGVIEKSSYVSYAKRFFPKSEVVELKDWNSVVKAVLNDEVLMAYRDEFEIKKVIKYNSEASLKLKTVLLEDVEDAIAIAINNNDTHLRNWINQFLEIKSISLNSDLILNKYYK